MSTMTRLDPDGMRAFAADATSAGEAARRLEHAVADIIASGSLTSGVHAPVLLNEIADEAGLLAELCRTKAEQMELADIGLYMPSMATLSATALDRLTASLTDDIGSAGMDGWDPFIAGEVRRLVRDGAEFDDAVEQALTSRQERIDTAIVEVSDLLAVSSQSGWTPWSDGDAEVSIDEAIQALGILNSLTDSEAAVVLAGLDPDAAERLATVVVDGNSAKASTGWGHTAWTPIRWVGTEVDGWGETIGNSVVAMFEESMRHNSRSAPNYGFDLGPVEPYAAMYVAGATEMATGNIPFLSNAAGCTLGDTSDCVWLAGEIAIEVAGGVVAGRVVSVVGRVGTSIFVRIADSKGGQAILAITENVAKRLFRRADGKAIKITATNIDDLAETTARNITPASPAIPDTALDGLVTPSRPLDPTATPGGTPERIGQAMDQATIGGITGENNAAQRLAEAGYDVVQRPGVPGPRNSAARPDFLIEGEIFDAYTPEPGTSVRNIFSNALGKATEGQTDRVIINMENSTRGLDELRRQFDDWAHTVEHLKEVLVVTADGDIVRIFP